MSDIDETKQKDSTLDRGQSNPETNPHAKREKINKDWLSLNADEEVLGWTHPSLFKFLETALTGIGIILIGLYVVYLTHFGDLGLSDTLLTYAQYVSYGVVLFGFIFISIMIFKYFRMFYVITSDKLVPKTAIIEKNPDYIPLHQIQMSRIRQEKLGLEEWLGFGHIYVATAATSREEVTLPYVPAPYEFKRILEDPEEFMSNPEDTSTDTDRESTAKDLDDSEDLDNSETTDNNQDTSETTPSEDSQS